MPKRIVSWAVLLFSFAIISLGYKPETDQWGAGYDSQYHVPFVTAPYVVYEIMGVIAIIVSLFFVIASFKKLWREKVEEFVNTRAYYAGFVVFWIVYTLSYLKGITSVISISPPVWVVNLVFYYGFFLFLLIPVLFFIGLTELRNKATNKNAGTEEQYAIQEGRALLSLNIIFEESKRKIDAQLAQIDGLDNKSGIVLAIAGVILTLIVTSIIAKPNDAANEVVFQITIPLILLSLGLSFISISIQRYHRPPKMERLWSHYLYEEPEETQKSIIKKVMDAAKQNEITISKRIILWKISYYSLGIALVISSVWIITIIW